MSAHPTTPARVPDLHKSAFWIYGVTAMVMREPLSIVLRHAAAVGWANPEVHTEALRALIVWMLMSRQFTAAGMYFDRVYLQTDSAANFARRSYPVDFMLGIGALLLSVGASTVVGVTGPLFDQVVSAALVWDFIWLAVSRMMGHTSVSLIAPWALLNLGILAIFCLVTWLAGSVAGDGALLVCTLGHLVRLMGQYGKLYVSGPPQSHAEPKVPGPV